MTAASVNTTRSSDGTWSVEFRICRLGYNVKSEVERTLDELIASIEKAEKKE